jgi:predicted Zn-dependent peptidase
MPPPLAGPRRIELSDPTAPPRVTYAWVVAPAYHPDDVELQVLATMLGIGPGNLLDRELVHDQKLANKAECGALRLAAGTTFVCEITPRKATSLDVIDQAFDKVIETIVAGKISAEALDRAKVQQKAELVRKLESVLSRAELINTYNHHLGKPDFFATELDSYEHVDVASIQAVAARWLVPEHRLTIRVKTEKRP